MISYQSIANLLSRGGPPINESRLDTGTTETKPKDDVKTCRQATYWDLLPIVEQFRECKAPQLQTQTLDVYTEDFIRDAPICNKNGLYAALAYVHFGLVNDALNIICPTVTLTFQTRREDMLPQSNTDGVGSVQGTAGSRFRLCIHGMCDSEILRPPGLGSLTALTGTAEQRASVYLPFAQLMGDMYAEDSEYGFFVTPSGITAIQRMDGGTETVRVSADLKWTDPMSLWVVLYVAVLASTSTGLSKAIWPLTPAGENLVIGGRAIEPMAARLLRGCAAAAVALSDSEESDSDDKDAADPGPGPGHGSRSNGWTQRTRNHQNSNGAGLQNPPRSTRQSLLQGLPYFDVEELHIGKTVEADGGSMVYQGPAVENKDTVYKIFDFVKDADAADKFERELKAYLHLWNVQGACLPGLVRIGQTVAGRGFLHIVDAGPEIEPSTANLHRSTQALAQLHSHDVLHGDLALHHVRLSGTSAVLIDFDYARIMPSDTEKTAEMAKLRGLFNDA